MKLCKECSTPVTKRDNIFCNRSCAAKYNNRSKDYSTFKSGPQTLESKLKTSLVRRAINKQKRSLTGPSKNYLYVTSQTAIKEAIANNIPYTKVYLCNCKKTNITWYSTSWKCVHPSVIQSKSEYRYQCRFNFSLSQFKDWFDYSSTLIETYGWYSASNKHNNLSGCSRDHMYSVSDGYANNVSPAIISHPANCEIKPHRLNQSKHSISSITLEELHTRIAKFDKQYANWRN
jgi:hypothetical protein